MSVWFQLRGRESDISIAPAVLAEHGPAAARLRRNLLDPLRAFIVRTENGWRRDMLSDPASYEAARMHHSCRDAVDVRKCMNAVQVWVHRHEPVELAANQIREDPRRKGFSGMECSILTQVGEVGRDQGQL